MAGEMVPILPEMMPVQKETPYDCFLVLCAVTGNNPANAPASFRQQQLGIAKRLLREGYSLVDIDGCLRWLAGRGRPGTILDLRAVLSQIGAWVFAGRPSVLSSHRGPLTSRDILDAARQVRAGD